MTKNCWETWTILFSGTNSGLGAEENALKIQKVRLEAEELRA